MRVAVIGCGLIAQVHTAALRSMEQISLCAFVDTVRERAEALAQGSPVYEDYREMLRQEKPDAVHICTPHHLHVPMAIDCLQAGCHVFLEKPAAINQHQLHQLADAYRLSDRLLGLCLQNRYNENVRYVLEQVRSRAMGKPLGGMALVAWQRDEEYYTHSDWRGRLDTEGGGLLINQAVHTLDLLQHLIAEGEVQQVQAHMANRHLPGIIEVEDTMEAQLSFQGGQRGLFFASNGYLRNAPVLIELVCEQGCYRLEDTFVYETREGKPTEVKDFPSKALGLGKDYWGSGHALCIRDFYDCLESGREFPLAFEKVHASIELMLACYLSARDQRAVSLPLPS